MTEKRPKEVCGVLASGLRSDGSTLVQRQFGSPRCSLSLIASMTAWRRTARHLRRVPIGQSGHMTSKTGGGGSPKTDIGLGAGWKQGYFHCDAPISGTHPNPIGP